VASDTVRPPSVRSSNDGAAVRAPGGGSVMPGDLIAPACDLPNSTTATISALPAVIRATVSIRRMAEMYLRSRLSVRGGWRR
jgi:hypothetical protein